MRIAIVVAAASAASIAIAAEDSRELGAHEHGSGALNIAFEGKSVGIEFEAPGADIVGFEHPATTAEDRAAIDAAVATLAKPLTLFVIPSAAGCTVTAANVELLTEGEAHDDHDEDHAGHKDEHGHDEDHAGHKDEHGHDEDHTGHKDEHDEDHAHKDEHGHDEHAEEEGGHTEFHAEYALTCADPAAIDSITFAYFTRFPNAEELDIQMISAKGAKGFEVERDEPSLNLSGAI